jgi:hypothetical protein
VRELREQNESNRVRGHVTLAQFATGIATRLRPKAAINEHVRCARRRADVCGVMLSRRWCWAMSVLPIGMFALVASCGDGNGSGRGGTPGLVSTCSSICDNVLAQCGVAPAVHTECLGACRQLELADVGCVDEFAAYIACVGGATSISCRADGRYIVVSPASCEPEKSAYDFCAGGGPPLAACFAQPWRDSVCNAARESTSHALFCVGRPAGCQSVEGGGVLGLYCCP